MYLIRLRTTRTADNLGYRTLRDTRGYTSCTIDKLDQTTLKTMIEKFRKPYSGAEEC